LPTQTKEGSTVVSSKRKIAVRDNIDPNKRYLSCTVVKGSAFADFVNVRSDESISISASFLKNRFHTKQVQCSTDPVFDETFMFEFVGDDENIRFDAAMLLKLNQPIHITILKHRKNEKDIVLGTKCLEWRSLLYCNQIEINAEVLPISLA
jgi:hypothetical protein